MQLTHGDHDVVVTLQAVLGEGLEDASGGREGDLAAIAVEQARTNFSLESTNLGRDCRLRHHQLFSGARKATQTAYFQECSQLLKIHEVRTLPNAIFSILSAALRMLNEIR